MVSDADFIRHTLACPQGLFTAKTGSSYKSRHDYVKHHTLLRVPRAYGIACTDEPDTYSDYYDENTTRRKPDVEYHLTPHLTVDLSIVYPSEDHDPGHNAKAK